MSPLAAGRTKRRSQPPTRTEIEPLYTKAETAQLMNVSHRFVTRLVLERRIRFVKVGRLVRIPRSAIQELLANGTVEPHRYGP